MADNSPKRTSRKRKREAVDKDVYINELLFHLDALKLALWKAKTDNQKLERENKQLLDIVNSDIAVQTAVSYNTYDLIYMIRDATEMDREIKRIRDHVAKRKVSKAYEGLDNLHKIMKSWMDVDPGVIRKRMRMC